MNKSSNVLWNDELAALERQGLRRRLRGISGPQGRKIFLDGREVLNFCSNNYLGLAEDPRLAQAAVECMEEEGFGAGASRLVCGSMSAHRRLEETLVRFKETEDCLLFNSGYTANIGIISSVFGRGDVIFSDRLNHASIVDGILLSRAECKRYPHKDMAALETMLRSSVGFKKRGIITDSVFSMDGDIAPLDEITALARRYDCLVMIDEAHAFGVLGHQGRGAAEYFGVEDKIDIQMGTLSKAAGSFGAYCCGSKTLVDFLINKARSFIYTTALPPAVAASARRAIEIIRDEPELRQRLWAGAHYLKKTLNDLGLNTGHCQTPIIPIIVGEPAIAVEFSKRLLEEGIFAGAIRPPTVPRNTARLRLTVTAAHTREDLDAALKKIELVGKELGLLNYASH